LAILLMAAVIAVGPLLWRDPTACSGDAGFHFLSWADAAHSMSMGVLYPHWAISPNFGAGEPRFVFYPPITWMAGAVLGMLLPLRYVGIFLFILLLLSTGLANRALAREAMADGPATLAGCAAIFLGYVLFCVYKRSDFAELTGGFWIPLLLLFTLRRRNALGNFRERTFDGSAAPLALIVAGIWLSNGPVGIMAGYLLAAVAMVSAVIEKSLAPVVRAVVSICVGMGLASIYLIPAVWERNWVSIQRFAVNPKNYQVENSWLFGRHADPALALHDMMLHQVSQVAVVMLAIALLAGVIAGIRGVVPGERKWWLPLALIPPAVLFLLLPVSEPVWNWLPELRFLQFPWRWLLVLEAPMALCFASAVWFKPKLPRNILIAVCAVVFVGISLEAPRWWFVECSSVLSTLQESVREGVGVPGKPEYAPPGIRFPLLSILFDPKGNPLIDPQGNPIVDFQGKLLDDPQAQPVMQMLHSACLLDTAPGASGEGETGLAPAWHGDQANCKGSGWRELVLLSDPSHPAEAGSLPEQKWIAGVADHAGYLILRLRYYPAWGVKVNGIPVTAVPERERGLMAVPVPKGNVQVSVEWTTTADVLAGRLVSTVALFLVVGLYFFERKLGRTHLGKDGASSPDFAREPKLPKGEPKRRMAQMRTEGRNAPSGRLGKTDARKGTDKRGRGGGSSGKGK
jgi:hypothetical protein